jgi:transcriptional regulator with XRE-family HTH domain
MPFAEKLKELREQAGLSQSAVAERAGLALRSIQNWEQGHRTPRAEAILAIAGAIGAPVEALLTEIARDKGAAKRGSNRSAFGKPRGRQPKRK